MFYDFRKLGGPLVCFAQMGDGPLRISATRNLADWYERLSSALPYELKLLAYLPFEKESESWLHEKELHAAFIRHRLRNEWFSPAQEILDYANTSGQKLPARKNAPPAGTAQPTALPNELLTIAQLATAIRVSKYTLLRMVREKTIPHLRIGKHIRFVLADVLDPRQCDPDELQAFELEAPAVKNA